LKIAKELQQDLNETKKKIESRRERQRESSSESSGAGIDQVYRSMWFAFEEKILLYNNNLFKPRLLIPITIFYMLIFVVRYVSILRHKCKLKKKIQKRLKYVE